MEYVDIHTYYLKRETKHKSNKDKRVHYTALELDKNKEVVCITHLRGRK